MQRASEFSALVLSLSFPEVRRPDAMRLNILQMWPSWIRERTQDAPVETGCSAVLAPKQTGSDGRTRETERWGLKEWQKTSMMSEHSCMYYVHDTPGCAHFKQALHTSGVCEICSNDHPEVECESRFENTLVPSSQMNTIGWIYHQGSQWWGGRRWAPQRRHEVFLMHRR